MRRHNLAPGHNKTRFIRLDAHLCQACWSCVEACPNGVIGKIEILFHRHAHIDHAAQCKGCGKCADTCPKKAISIINTGMISKREVLK